MTTINKTIILFLVLTMALIGQQTPPQQRQAQPTATASQPGCTTPVPAKEPSWFQKRAAKIIANASRIADAQTAKAGGKTASDLGLGTDFKQGKCGGGQIILHKVNG